MSIKDYTRYIVINGYEYQLNMRHTMAQIGAMGDQDPRTLEIRIAKDLHPQQQESTILHEILEAIVSAKELPIEHRDLCTLEVDLRDTLRRNGVSLKPLLEPKMGE